MSLMTKVASELLKDLLLLVMQMGWVNWIVFDCKAELGTEKQC